MHENQNKKEGGYVCRLLHTPSQEEEEKSRGYRKQPAIKVWV